MRLKGWLIIALGVILVVAECSVMLAENSLRISHRPQPDPSIADRIAAAGGASWQTSEVGAVDGIPLRAWLFLPREPNGSAAILLHGVGDSRRGVSSQAVILLQHGFTVLAPDSRGHGSSGGSLIGYGVFEADDVHRWADWLLSGAASARLYGLGESMGAAILLESLRVEPRFRAVVAECPFAEFHEVAFDRLHQFSGLPAFALWPFVTGGEFYARQHYGIDFRQASPEAAVAGTRTPILLIHGERDTNIPPRHSRELHAVNPQATTVWIVPGATHVAALVAAPEEYARRVVSWFTDHP
ncbi:MAG TPA: alpha/beta fold hydrolase [Bryobacteraceae bacterium]|nr:alpha/beta fold hydrolase [Bryobacteraceae bacterium]